MSGEYLCVGAGVYEEYFYVGADVYGEYINGLFYPIQCSSLCICKKNIS